MDELFKKHPINTSDEDDRIESNREETEKFIGFGNPGNEKSTEGNR